MAAQSAEEILNQVHEVDIPSLFSLNLSQKERAGEIRLAKQKLKAIKKQLKQEMDVIKKQWDGRNAYEGQQERLHLAPYQSA